MTKEIGYADLPEQLLAKALAAGAEAAEVYQSNSLERPILFEGNRLKQIETTQAEGVALRLWKAGKPGLAVGYGPVDPNVLVEKALAISVLNEAETPRLVKGKERDFGSVGEPMAVELLVEKGREAIERVRDRYPEAVCEASLSCDVEQVRLLTSAGLDYRSKDTTLSGYISAEVVEGEDFLCVSDGVVNRDSLDMRTVSQSILQRMDWAQRTVKPLDGPKKGQKNGQVPVIFTAGAAGLLWDTITSALNGKRMVEGSSPWVEKLGSQVMSDRITLRQDPRVGPYSCPFDDEGMLTKSITFVENGVIKSWFSDLAVGEKGKGIAGLEGSTGNGIRPGLGSYPTPGLVNLLISPGELRWDELIQQYSDAIVVDQVLGEGGDITGDLSINLELGYRVKDGEIVGRVKDTMVSGNAYTALGNVLSLGRDTEWCGSVSSCAIAVSGLSVVG
ncbi:MAG: metallopeptidase TldD-related protein [Cyanobacteria bacterium J06621_11]